MNAIAAGTNTADKTQLPISKVLVQSPHARASQEASILPQMPETGGYLWLGEGHTSFKE